MARKSQPTFFDDVALRTSIARALVASYTGYENEPGNGWGLVGAAAWARDHGTLLPNVVVDYDDAKHEYKINGEKVPSVTKILDETMPKPALAWWSFRIGIAGIIRAIADSQVTTGQLMAWAWEPIISPAKFTEHPEVHVDQRGKAKHEAEKLMMAMKHHPNAIKEEKGSIGTSIHVAAEKLAMTGSVPTIEDFPEDDRGYVQALARWYMAAEPEFEHIEVIAASPTFKYAGRFDGIAKLKGTPGRSMLDYKTSGGVYDSFDVQLSGYDLAWLEMGNEPLQGHFIIHLRPDGTYEQVPVTIDHADFLVQRLALEQGASRAARVKALGRS